MKKTVNINLGGTPLVIDEDAYEALHRYLENLKTRLGDRSGCDEIMEDIEARLSEMLMQGQKAGKSIVSLSEVEAAIAQMGSPDDIAGDEKSGKEKAQDAATHRTTTRRLYRDAEDKVIAGVISGLCHYFGISDPVWARIGTALLVIAGFGFPILLYIILALLVPVAETPAEKLMMRGEPVTVANIEKEVKEAAGRAMNMIKSTTNKSGVEKFFSGLGTVILWLIKFFVIFVALVSAVVLIALLAALFGVSLAGNEVISLAPDMLISDRWTALMLKAGLILFVAAPVLGLFYWVVRNFFGIKKKNYALRTGLALMWVTGILLMLWAGKRIGKEFQYKSSRTETIKLPVDADTAALQVHVTTADGSIAEKDENLHIALEPGEGLVINGKPLEEWEKIPVGEPTLYITAAHADSFTVQLKYTARGNSRADALHHTTNVYFPVTVQQNKLLLPEYVYINPKSLWRVQHVSVYLGVPAGKKVALGNNIDRYDVQIKDDDRYKDAALQNTVWTNTNGRLQCSVCPAELFSDAQEEEDSKEK
ncbi:MAG: PspC domain-containing protein [Chitinophagales bacterium]|nr:PspC domain-containing protein [Chitinophagales bacterium]MDW8419927.1 PspC domain-containing protein [Chitinophagales bacterium]